METSTKIIVTIGPSSSSKEMIAKLIEGRMDMVRLNFSWGTHESYAEIIKNIRDESKRLNITIPIIQDLSGPRVQEGDEHHFGGKEKEEIITEKDINDLSFGIEQGVEYIAMSYVGSGDDVIELKKIIKEKGGNQKVLSKVERRIAIDNLDSIIEASDGIIIARGDLGNEFPLEEIPFIQHQVIQECNKANKMVAVATQMLLSMVENPIPTRAEVSDVAYAILDGANGVMLSEESAKGNHPIEALMFMKKISKVAEKYKDSVVIG